MTVLYSFGGTRSEKTLECVKTKNKYILTNKSINEDIEKLISLRAEYIIGLGDYSGKDKDKISNGNGK